MTDLTRFTPCVNGMTEYPEGDFVLYEDAKRRITELEGSIHAPKATRYAWLIENGKGGNDLRYRSMDQGQPTWTTSPHEALNFARREDAERFAAEDEDAWRIVEHGFDI